MDSFELKITMPPEVGEIAVNYEELKEWISTKVKDYVGLVYSDDQIKLAKTDIANLRKVSKQLSDERIKLKKEYMKPFTEFEDKIKDLDGIINKGITSINKQIKDFEDERKEKKKEQLKAHFDSLEKPFEIKFERILNARWLNATFSIESAKADMEGMIKAYARDLDLLATQPEYAFEAQEVYKTTLDMQKALCEPVRLRELAKKKEAYEKSTLPKAEEIISEPPRPEPAKEEPPKQEAEGGKWVRFEAYLTRDTSRKLSEFLKAEGIMIRRA